MSALPGLTPEQQSAVFEQGRRATAAERSATESPIQRPGEGVAQMNPLIAPDQTLEERFGYTTRQIENVVSGTQNPLFAAQVLSPGRALIAMGHPPERVAKALEFIADSNNRGLSFGQTVESVDQLGKDLEHSAILREIYINRDNHPLLTDLLIRTPEMAGAMAPDFKVYAELERMLTQEYGGALARASYTTTNMTSNIARSILNLPEYLQAAREQVSLANQIPDDSVFSFLKKYGEYSPDSMVLGALRTAADFYKANYPSFTPGSPLVLRNKVEQFAYDNLSAGVQVAATIGTAILAPEAGAFVVPAFFGAVTAGGSYENYRDMNVNPLTAVGLATAGGVVTFFSEKLPFEAWGALFLKKKVNEEVIKRGFAGALKALAPEMAIAGFTESASEVVDEVGQGVTNLLAEMSVKDLSRTDIATRILTTVDNALYAGATVIGPSLIGMGGKVVSEFYRFNQNKLMHEAFDLAGKTLEGLDPKSSPVVIAKAIQTLNDNSPVTEVRVPAELLERAMFQLAKEKGLSEQQAEAALLEMYSNLKVAQEDVIDSKQTGNDIVVDHGLWQAYAGSTEFGQRVRSFLKFTEDGLTLTEMEDFQERLGAEMQDLQREYLELAENNTLPQQIVDIRNQLVESKQMSAAEADTNMKLLYAFSKIAAGRRKISLEDWWARNPISVKFGDVVIQNQIAETVDPVALAALMEQRAHEAIDRTLGIQSLDTTVSAPDALLQLSRDGGAEAWVEKFLNDPELVEIFGKDQIDKLGGDMVRTAAVYAHLDLTPEELKGDPLRNNADPLFSLTFDLSTICPQQEQYVATVRALERAYKGIFPPEVRDRVGAMLKDYGISASCWYCYGQTKRDIREYYVQRGAEIFNYAVLLAKQNKGKPLTDDQIKEALKVTGGNIAFESPKTGERSHLVKLIMAEAGKGKKLNPVRMRDIIYDGAKPKTALEKAAIVRLRDFANGASGANKEKGFEGYRSSVLNITPAAVEFFNSVGGIRMNSQTDFRSWHIVDVAQFITHLAQKGLGAHAYTKEPWFIRIFGDTGIKFNMSMEAITNADGSVEWDAMEGFPPDTKAALGRNIGPASKNLRAEDNAISIRKSNPHAGTMLMVSDDKQFLWGLENKDVDMMIPLHAEGVNKEAVKRKKAKSYSQWQHEDWKGFPQKADKKFVTVKDGVTTIKMDDGTTVKVSPPPKNMRSKPESTELKDTHPIITQAAHNNDAKRYLEICRKLGIKPKWDGLVLEDGTVVMQMGETAEQDVYHPGVMKIIRDIATVEAQQVAADPTKINWAEAQKFLDMWIEQGGDQTVAIPGVVEAIRQELNDAGILPRQIPSTLAQDARGAIQFQDTQALITLTEKADKSTFAHEMVHYFVRDMKLMRDAGIASQDVLDDLAILEAFSNEEDLGAAFETYLLEGKAPSVELLGIFRTFKNWLKKIYTTLLGAGVVPSAEVKGVFDRMLASDAAIAQKEHFYGMVDSLAALLPEGTPHRQRALDSEDKAKKTAREKLAALLLKAWLKAEGVKDSLREAAEKELEDNPGYMVLKTLKSVGPLNADAVAARFGEQAVATLKRHGTGLVTKAGKTNMDDLAAVSDFESTEGMMSTLMELPPYREAVDAIVDREIAKKEQQFLDEGVEAGGFDALTEAEVHSEERWAALAATYDALVAAVNRQKGVSQRTLNAKAIREVARRKLHGRPIHQAIQYNVYSRATAKFSKLAHAAAKNGRLEEARDHLNRALLNNALVLESLRINKDVKAIKNRAANILAHAGNVDYDFRVKILELVKRYALVRTKKTVPLDVPSWDSLRTQAGEPVDATGHVAQWIQEEKTLVAKYQDLTYEQLLDLNDAIVYLNHVGKDQLLSALNAQFETSEQLADAGRAPMDKLPAKGDLPWKGTWAHNLIASWKGYTASLNNITQMMRAADGYANAGKNGKVGVNENIAVQWEQADSRQSDYLTGKALKAMNKFLPALKKMTRRFEKEFGTHITADRIGLPMHPRMAATGNNFWDANKLFTALLNTGNDGNINALLKGYGWGQSHIALVRDLFTDEELDIAQGIWDMFETIRPDVDEVYFRVNNAHMTKVDPLPFEVRGKKMAGGYMPLSFDPTLSTRAQGFTEEQLMRMRSQSVQHLRGPKDGFSKERQGGLMPPLLDLAVVYRHLHDTAHYITHEEIARDTIRVIKNKKWHRSFEKAFGAAAYNQLVEWVRYTANPSAESNDLTASAWFNKHKRLATISALGFRLLTAAKQPLSLTEGFRELGVVNMAKGIAAFANPATALKMKSWVDEQSTMMRNRRNNVFAELRKEVNVLTTKQKFEKSFTIAGKEFTASDIQDYAFVMIGAADAMATYPIWMAKYQAERANNTPHEQAVALADHVVTSTQPSGRPVDLVGWQRATDWRRLFSFFRTWTLKMGGILRYNYNGWTTKVDGKRAIPTTEFVRSAVYSAIVPAMAQSLLVSMFKSGEPPEKEQVLIDAIGYWTAGFPILGDVPTALNYYNADVGDSPVFRGLDNVVNFIKATNKAQAEYRKDGQVTKEVTQMWIDSLLEIGGYQAGMPWIPTLKSWALDDPEEARK